MSSKYVKNRKNNTPSLSGEGIEDTLQLKKLIHEQLASYAKEKKLEQKTFTELTEIVNEFLNCFILLGYNYSGEPVSIVTCKNQQHADSLGTMLQRFIAQSPEGPGGGISPDVEI